MSASKLIIGAVFAVLAVSFGFGLFHFFTGNYLQNNLIGGLWVLLALLVIGIGIYKLLRLIWPTLILLLFISQGCERVKSNQQFVVSEDCGKTWRKISAGDHVPKSVANYCYMSVVMPNFPMQGDSKFVANLMERVRATTQIDYDYSITDPLAFIQQAKYLGKSNIDPDNATAIGAAFEGAENMVIDKRIRDVAKSVFLQEDIVELDQAELENKLQAESNKVLEPLGIHLNFITLTFELDEQTRQAIDISTAMKIYQSRGLAELGKQVMIQRAGAARIVVEKETPAPQPAEQ